MKNRTDRVSSHFCPEFFWQVFFWLFLIVCPQLAFIQSPRASAIASPPYANKHLAQNLGQITREISEKKEAFQIRKKLRIAITENSPPLSFRDPNGNLIGLEIDLARAIALELLGDANAVEFVPVSNRDRLKVVTNNQVDLAIAQITLTPNRARLVDFTLPYYTNSTVVVTKRDRQRAEIATGAIAVLKQSATIAILQSNFPKAQLIGIDSYQQGLAALANNQVQAIAGDNLAFTIWLQTHPQFGIIAPPLATHSLAIAMPRGLQHQELFRQTTRAIANLRQNGWLKSTIQKWQLP